MWKVIRARVLYRHLKYVNAGKLAEKLYACDLAETRCEVERSNFVYGTANVYMGILNVSRCGSECVFLGPALELHVATYASLAPRLLSLRDVRLP